MRSLPNLRAVPSVLTALLVLSAPGGASAQDRFRYERAWALAGPCCGDSGHDIAVEPDGSFFIAGNYGALDLDGFRRGRSPGPRAVALPGSGNNRIGTLALAANGDVIVGGYTQGFVDLNGDGTADVRSTGARQTPYVARFDSRGGLAWVRVFRQQQRLAILDLAASADRIAVSGLFERWLDLDGDGRPDAAADPDGRSEGFVAILDVEGAVQHVLAITGPGHDQPRGVAFAPDGRSLAVTGFVRLTADFDGDGVPEGGVQCDNFGDIIFARYRLKP